MTAKTKKYKKIYKVMNLISWLCCFGTAAILIFTAFLGHRSAKGEAVEETTMTVRMALGEVIYAFLMANVPLVVLAIIVKDKIKPVVYMADVVMANIFFGGNAIYLVFGLWLLDTYVVTYLKELYRDRYRINKEIDARG